MKKSTKIFIALILSVIVGFFFLLLNYQSDNSKTIEYNSPKYSDVKNTRLLSGVIVPKKEIALKSNISGIIDQLFVVPGQKVKAGNAIARIKLLADPATLESTEKQVKVGELNFQEAELKYLRNKTLFENNVIPQMEFEAAEKNYFVSKEELLSATKQLEIVKRGYAQGKTDVSDIVYSTISGIVLDLPLKEGSSIIESNTYNDGSTIATIADMNDVVFKAKVAEKDIQYLNLGMNFEISINAFNNQKFETCLSHISSKGKEENGTIKFDIEGNVKIPVDADYIIRSGYTSVGEIVLERVLHALTIDEKLIRFIGDSTFVYIDLNGKKILRKIELGVSDGVIVEVRKGIVQTDKIIEKEGI